MNLSWYVDNNVTRVGFGSSIRARAPYRCTSILGVTMSKARCLQLCYNYYAEIHPYAHCDNYPPGSKTTLCYCEHDCIKT